jgi:DNA-binding MarR family transcriptional regulator
MDDGEDGAGGGAGREHLYFALLNEASIVAQLARALFEASATGDVSLPQFGVLNHLVRLGDGRTPHAIAAAFQVPRPSMTHTLGLLEARGLIAMRGNPRDGRSKLVHLTPAGRAAREAAIAGLAPALARIAAAFPPERAEALLPLLSGLRAVLDADRDRPRGDAGVVTQG